MNNNPKKTLEAACRLVLRPLALMMLRCGMTWREFATLSKSVFVQAATEEFGISGRPTNVSRVSILTGIDRKEVKRQRELLKSDVSASRGKTTDATRVLSGWFQDPTYVDGDGNPRLLPVTGPAPSFESLCGSYGGDIAASTMLKELLNTGTIEKSGNSLLRAVRRYYQPAVHDDENLRWATSFIGDLVNTMNNNVFPTDKHIPRFGRMADNDRIPASKLPAFGAFLDDKGQAFLEQVDDWLTQHGGVAGGDANETVRIGIGLFAIQNNISQERSK